MKKWVVSSTLIPTNHNYPQCLVIEAASGEDAVKIAKDHFRDLSSVMTRVYSVSPYVPPPEGRVIGSR